MLDIHSVGTSIDGGRVARVEATRAVEFFPQCHNETVQVLNIGFPIFPNSFLQTGIGLIGQSVGGCVGQEVIPNIGLAIESVSDAVPKVV
jgi:hypothetical protein